MNIAIDIGNTLVKGAVFKKNKMAHCITIDTMRLYSEESVREFVASIYDKNIPIGFCSVVPKLSELFTDIFQHERTFISISAAIKTPFTIHYKTPETLGSDRIALAAYGYKLAQEHSSPIVVVNCGTATTFEVITEKGVYMGGLILTGINTSLYAISQRTASLPHIELNYKTKLIGQSTIECMEAGAYWGFISQVQGILFQIEKKLKRKIYVVATGGNSFLLKKQVPEISIFEKEGTLKGVQILVEYNQ